MANTDDTKMKRTSGLFRDWIFWLALLSGLLYWAFMLIIIFGIRP